MCPKLIPQMIERKSGHIINIGSTAAKEVYPNGNVYCASKHAVDALNQGMRIDLNPFGMRRSHSPRHGRNRI
jgi:NADP-dependent 3-hydroxy acid dehydrogenase YdfG